MSALCGNTWTKNRGIRCGKRAGHPVDGSPRDHEFTDGNTSTAGWPDSEGEPAWPAGDDQ